MAKKKPGPIKKPTKKTATDEAKSVEVEIVDVGSQDSAHPVRGPLKTVGRPLPSERKRPSEDLMDHLEPTDDDNTLEDALQDNSEYRDQLTPDGIARDAADWEDRGWVPGNTELLDNTDDVETDAAARADDLIEANVKRATQGTAETGLVSSADPIAQYMAEVRKYPLLTREQERALAVHYRETGDKRAAEALVTSNLRFVVKIAAEYSKFGARLIDLVQEGNVGLMHAVREFNPYKGVRLITYAVWWIRGYIQDYLMRQYSMVRIGTTQSQRKLFYRLQKEKELLESMGEEPSVKLLSSRLGVSESDVETMTQRMQGRDVSLQTTVDESGQTTLLDFEASDETPVDERLGNQEMLSILHEGLEDLRGSLNERERELLEDRLLADEPMTLQEIGEKYGVTREAVRQMENRLMTKIRKILEERLSTQRR
ncbi:MAG: RNA polymerase factor sigma-32 [Bdellovibrionales bacterium]|jgi:RNA polymerase sigma-32 factor|nr:RNA polymerase factor sigma-32 [Bdellovibrionales bacterium]